MNRNTIAALAFLGMLVASPVAFAQASLETFVMNVAGNPSGVGCGIGSAPAPVSAVFGANGNFIPVPGISLCALGGALRDQTATAGVLLDALSLVNYAFDTNLYTGSGRALARYGILEGESHSSLSGFGTYGGSQGMSVSRDRLTITSPSAANGSNGTLVFRTTISGSLAVAGNSGTIDVEIWYLVNGAGRVQMRARATTPTAIPVLLSQTDTVTGFTLVNGSMTGSDEVNSHAIPFVFGTPFDFRLALLAYTTPSLNSSGDSNFSARITGIEVRDAANQIVASFQVAADSGTTYGPNGVPMDIDADGVPDLSDNCVLVANPTQLDTDTDGYGNICDADLNNSGTVTTADFGLLRSVLGQPASFNATAAAADMNGSGTVTTADFGLRRARLGTPPGPSGLVCAGTVPCP